MIETGDSGPITPIGINLPNDQRVREAHGSKSVTLSNVTEAYERATTDELPPRVLLGRRRGRARAERWGAIAGELATKIHEVIGHGSGAWPTAVTAQPQELLKEQYSALEETRADLVALYFCADPQLAELGHRRPPSITPRSCRTEYEAYARNALVQLRRVREGTQLEEDHMRNRQAIVHWLLANTAPSRCASATAGPTTSSTERGASARASARLLREVQRIKSEGDYAAARALFETYGVHFDPELRNEIVGRVDRLELPSYTGFVMPTLTPVHGAGGEITDVRIWYPCDFAGQMLATLKDEGGAGGRARTSG